VTKKQKGILLGVLVWAGLLIAVLYSPIGSPNLYSSQNYYAINQGVNFENNEIPNATKVRTSTDNADNNDPDIPDVSGTELGATGSSVSNTPSTTSSAQGSSYAAQSPALPGNNSSGSAGGGGVAIIAGGGSRSSAGSSGVSMTSGGITTLSSSNLSYSSVKQASKTGTLGTTGGTDPGGDPTGAPIPVGDGWGLFVLFGCCYAAFKKRGFLKNKLTFSAKRR
jgi:hypothetical protein